MVRCPTCGKVHESDARYCVDCGGRLDGAGAAAADGPEAGDRRIVTVAFIEISGLGALCAGVEARLGVLNGLFQILGEVIYRYGGTIDKYIGEVVMAVFGAPRAHEDDARRAVMAAWEMLGAAERYRQAMTERWGAGPAIRIGLNTGLVVAGRVGGAKKQEYTVLGDAVNVAQRMEANAEVGGILLTAETRRQAGEGFVYGPLAAIQVKNRRKPVEAYRLEGLDAQAGPSARPSTFGRAEELSTLAESWVLARSGSPLAVAITGEAGMGKTALVASALADFHAARPPLRVACSSYDARVPMKMVSDVLRIFLQLPHGPVDRSDLERAMRVAWQGNAADALVLDVCGFVLGQERSGRLAALSPEALRTIAFRLVTEALIGHAHLSPVVLAIDHVQWADHASREWLAALAVELALRQSPMLVVLAGRAFDTPTPLQLPGLARNDIALGPLEPEDARALFKATLTARGAPHPDPRVQASLLRRAAGNPGTIVALAESCAVGHLPGGDRKGALPVSLMALALARLDDLALGPVAADLLEAVAVLGAMAERDLVAALAPSEGHATARDELLVAGILVGEPGPEDRVDFASDLLREGVYERMLLARRRALHARALGLLDLRRAEPAILAWHAAQASLGVKAAHYLTLAAERALALYANDDALALADEGRDVVAAQAPDEREPGLESRLLGVRCMALAARGDLAAAVVLAEDLVGLSATPAERAHAGERLAALVFRTGDLARAEEICDRELAAVEETTAGRLRLDARRAQIRLRRGEIQEALADCARLEPAVPDGEPALRGLVRIVKGGGLLRLGKAAAALAAYEGAVADLRAGGDLYWEVVAEADLGVVATQLGLHDQALSWLKQALAHADRIGDRRMRAYALNNLAALMTARGRWDEARGHFERALAENRAIGDRLSAAIALHNVGECSARLADHAAAETSLVEANELFAELGARDFLAESFRQIAEVRTAQQNHPAALQALAKCSEVAGQTGQRALQGTAMRMIAETHARLGHAREALEWVRRALAELEALEAPAELARAQEVESGLLARSPEPLRTAPLRGSRSDLDTS